jgi:hypothetical protein
MKSNPGAVGNVNLRGKKSWTLSCGCCDMYDFRDDEREREAQKEIDAALTDKDYRRELRDDDEMFSFSDLHPRYNADVAQW